MGDEHAHGGLRPGGDAGVGSDDDARPVSVVLYSAQGCHLCERAREVLVGLQAELGFALEEIDIGGDAELEARYRELLPVVEIGGRRAFVYFVDPDGFRRKLAQSRAAGAGS